MEDGMVSQEIRADVAAVNLSPEVFHRYAIHYYQCKQDFNCPDGFSPVPYFLLCRAIELELKSRHLVNHTQIWVKTELRHDLSEAYKRLASEEQLLNSTEVKTLNDASDIYDGKGFEYFDRTDALTGYSRYPDLAALDSLAKKLIGESRQPRKPS